MQRCGVFILYSVTTAQYGTEGFKEKYSTERHQLLGCNFWRVARRNLSYNNVARCPISCPITIYIISLFWAIYCVDKTAKAAAANGTAGRGVGCDHLPTRSR